MDDGLHGGQSARDGLPCLLHHFAIVQAAPLVVGKDVLDQLPPLGRGDDRSGVVGVRNAGPARVSCSCLINSFRRPVLPFFLNGLSLLLPEARSSAKNGDGLELVSQHIAKAEVGHSRKFEAAQMSSYPLPNQLQ